MMAEEANEVETTTPAGDETTNTASENNSNSDTSEGVSVEGEMGIVSGASNAAAADAEEDASNKENEEGTETKEGDNTVGEGGEEENPSGADEETVGKEYVSFDNPDVQSVVDVLKDNKIPREKAEEIFGEAYKSGDLSTVDVPELERVVGKNTAKMMMGQLTQAATAQTQAKTAAVAAIHEAAGGQDAWDTAAAWAGKHVSAQDKADINSMLAAGGKQAVLATQEVMKQYKASNQYVEPANLIKGDGGSSAVGTPLDQVAYVNELTKEHNRSGGPRAGMLKQIEARRALARK